VIEYFGDDNNVNDLYLRNCFYWAAKYGLTDQVIQINNGDKTEDHNTNNRPFVLMITGNENHECLDHYYEDPRVLSIIKNYPYMKNVANDPTTTRSYEIHTYENSPRFLTLPEDPRTLNIPLGTTNDFLPYNFPNKVFKTGFIGQWTKIREMYLTKINKCLAENNADLNQFQFALYSGFGPFVQDNKDDGSLPTEIYSVNLANYQMALNFSGQSPETYRLCEAAASGCGIISTILPDTWYYKRLPALFISCETDFELPMYKTLLDSNIVNDWRKAATAWYHQYATPKAVGQKIASHTRASV